MKKFILLLLFIYSSPAFCQHKLIKQYTYSSITYMLSPMEMNLYYMIDSAKTITCHHKTYYQLTISTDTSDYMGYISMNIKKRRIDFVSKHNQKTSTPLFQFKPSLTAKIPDAGFLGDLIKIRSSRLQPSKQYIMQVEQWGLVASEDIVIGHLDFSELTVYPASITFIDPTAGMVSCQAKSPSNH